MRQIILNEWRFLYRSRIFIALTVGFVLLLVLSIILSKKQEQQQYDRYVAAKTELREQWEQIDSMNPHSAAHYGTYVFKPTTVLSNLDEGIRGATGNVLRVEGHVQNEMVHSEASQMASVSRFGKLKIALLLQYILPLILIFLAFNAINSERQSSRLKLLVLQGRTATSVLVSKVLAVWLYGLLLLLVVVVSYLFLHLDSISSDILRRLGFFVLSYSLYYFIIVGLGVYLVARLKSSLLALTGMLGIWILWTIFLPNIVLTRAEQWHDLPSRNAFKSAMREDRSKGIDGHNPSDERGKALEQRILAEYNVDSLSQLPINFDGIRMQEDEEYGNKVWDKHFGLLDSVLKTQKETIQYFGILSPFISLRNSSMAYTGNDNMHHQEFLRQVEDYRRVFIKELNDKHAYGGSKTGDWGWKAQNDFFKSVKDFDYEPIPLSQMAKHYLMDIGILIVWSSIIIGLLVFGLKRISIV